LHQFLILVTIYKDSLVAEHRQEISCGQTIDRFNVSDTSGIG
jgi:hypothetical protein